MIGVIFWIVCGLISVCILVTEELEEDGVITLRIVDWSIILLLAGPLFLGLYWTSELWDKINLSGDTVIYHKKKIVLDVDDDTT